MTNTKFRKRALLSSVAMLLVALVALGSATFAWFIDDPNANAKGIKAKAQAATGLLIASDSEGLNNYKKSVSIGKTGTPLADLDITLAPAATANATDYFYVKGTAYDNGEAATGEKWKDVAENNHKEDAGVYYENISLKRTGTIETGKTAKLYLKNAYITFTNDAMADAAVIMLLDSSNAIKAVFTKTALPNQYTAITLNGDYSTSTKVTSGNGRWTRTVHNSTDGTDNKESHITDSENGLEIGSFGPTSATQDYKLYIWLDGDNSAVKSENATAANELISACNLYFIVADPA